MNERVLVTGANGFVGKSVCRKLIASGLNPVAGVRDLGVWPELQQTVPGLTDVAHLGDLSTNPQLQSALSGVSAIVHLAARVHVMKESASDPVYEFRKTNVSGSKAIALAAVAAGVRRIIFVSTVKVLGESTAGTPFRDDDLPNPEDPYAISKREAEDAIRAVVTENGLEVVIVRPPLVYGPQVQGNFLRLIKLVDRGLPVPWPERANCRSMIGVDNLADFLVRCVDHPNADGQSFLVKDAEDLSTHELMARLAHLLDRPLRLFPFPEGLIRFAATLASQRDAVNRLLDSLVIDSSRAQQLLGWAPPVTVDDGLAATVRWYRESVHPAEASAF
ncbi:MAG TPA: NAD-dependent epimerase/dehydratase family protein [Terracidiphilus sp.]|nr:NAD-dependent epimerase/dehydratase family protein [Terracidiphilus sp.]